MILTGLSQSALVRQKENQTWIHDNELGVCHKIWYKRNHRPNL